MKFKKCNYVFVKTWSCRQFRGEWNRRHTKQDNGFTLISGGKWVLDMQKSYLKVRCQTKSGSWSASVTWDIKTAVLDKSEKPFVFQSEVLCKYHMINGCTISDLTRTTTASMGFSCRSTDVYENARVIHLTHSMYCQLVTNFYKCFYCLRTTAFRSKERSKKLSRLNIKILLLTL
jgi:hypothetical protein